MKNNYSNTLNEDENRNENYEINREIGSEINIEEYGFKNSRILEDDKIGKSIFIKLEVNNLSGEELKNSVEKMVSHLLKGGRYFKVTLALADTTYLGPFLRCGFTLEGILKNQRYFDGYTSDEFILGVTSLTFLGGNKERDIELKSERLSIKLIGPDIAEDFLEYYKENKEFLKSFEPLREEGFYTYEGQVKDLKEKYTLYLNGYMIPFGIYYKEKLIGRISISNIVLGSFRSCIIGYGLHKDYLRKGLMSEAVSVITDYCFNELNLHRVEASTLVDNKASQGVLLKNGFNQVGLNKNYLFINNKWRDHYTFSLTKDNDNSN